LIVPEPVICFSPGRINEPKGYFNNPDNTPFMRNCAVLLMIIVVLSMFFAGCTQFSGTSPVTPAVPATTVPTPEPETSAPPAALTSAPQQVVTIIHQVSLIRDIKDSELLFTLQVPVEWKVTTHRLINPDNSEGLVYQTDVVGDNVFYIHTYAVSRNQDQAYRDQFRKWSPPPTETAVTINDITYERFESTADGKTTVAYVARKSSANERGYASMIAFTANDSNRFERGDYERIVASFRYFGGNFASSMPGEEIPRVSPPLVSSGSA
jgi:hypothetical protein